MAFPIFLIHSSNVVKFWNVSQKGTSIFLCSGAEMPLAFSIVRLFKPDLEVFETIRFL